MPAVHRRVAATGPSRPRSHSVMTHNRNDARVEQKARQGTNPLLEAWLQTSLKHRYDDALSEPLPEHLLQLLDA